MRLNSMALTVTIARVNETLYDDEAVSVTLPGVGGEMTILDTHEPLISTLQSGTIIVRPHDGEPQRHIIERGLVEMTNSHCTVLV